MRKRFLAPFHTKTDHFTKTGSGQTYAKLKKESRFLTGYQNATLPGQINVSQAEFEKIALGQVTELWSNYGNLSEIWFDGGYGGDMATGIEQAIKKQPTAVGFGGEGVMPGRGLGWTGTESGHPDCPGGIWSTGGSPCGAANSR